MSTRSDERDAIVQTAHEAIAEHDWQKAFEILVALDDVGTLSCEELDALADASFWSGHPTESLALRQRAYAAYSDADRFDDAAMAALFVCGAFFLQRDTSAAAGWLGRAQRLLEALPECSAHAFMAWLEGQLMTLLKGHDQALERAQQAEAIARRVGDRDLIALGISMQGYIRIHVGEVDIGMRLLDEALATATAGELGPFATAEIFCEMVVSSLEVADYERASRWLETAERAGRSIVCFPGCCRVHRASVLRHRGAWPDAETEAQQARTELGGGDMLHDGMALTEIGELHRCRGELAVAEEAFAEAHERGWSPQPGLAHVLVARADLDGAKAMVERSIEHAAAEPGALLRLLPALVEISLATSDVEGARSAEQRLAEVAAGLGTSAARAASMGVRGLLSQEAGELPAAVREFETSIAEWQQARNPYETAHARIRLAEVLIDLGDEASARLERVAAHKTFERLGAVPEAREAATRLGLDTTTTSSCTFMFTDIVSSTTLLASIGDDAWHQVRRWHDRTVGSIVARRHGKVVKSTGDGFFVSFPEPNPAVECAIEIQRALDDHRRSEGFAPSVRIGLHTGSAIESDGDYAGRDVVIASRLESGAARDEILISLTLAQLLHAGFDLHQRAPMSLKGIPDPVEVRSVEWRGTVS